MKLNFEVRHLTGEEKKQLDVWEVSSDPTERLFTEFYTWTRWALLNEYFESAATDDLSVKDEAWESLESTLKKLREDYIRDLELFIEMQQAVTNMFSPQRIKLQLA